MWIKTCFLWKVGFDIISKMKVVRVIHRYINISWKKRARTIYNQCVYIAFIRLVFCVSWGEKLLYIRQDCERAFLLVYKLEWGEILGKTPQNPSISYSETLLIRSPLNVGRINKAESNIMTSFDRYFSNSSIIHQVKRITTVKEVWIPGLN